MTLQARTEANELFIAMYETEEPKIENYRTDNRFFFKGDKERFNRDFKKWQSSKREYEVRDEDKEKVKQEIYKNWKGYGADSHPDLEDSIDCTFLKDRLKLGVNCKYDYTSDPKCTKGDCDCEQRWTLLPLEDKKENEAKYTKEQMIFIIRKMLEDEKIKYHYVREWLDEKLHTLDLITFKNPNKQE